MEGDSMNIVKEIFDFWKNVIGFESFQISRRCNP